MRMRAAWALPAGLLLAFLLLAASGAGAGLQGSRTAAASAPSFSRLQRKSLALDFIVPSLFRTYLRELLLEPSAAPFKARCRLVLDCPPLLLAAGPWLPRSPSAAEPSGKGGGGGGGAARAPSKVLKGPAARKLRRAKQLVLEVGEGKLRQGCQGEPGAQLEFGLSEEFSWWLRSGEGRLRIRLMPERKASFQGREGRLSAAIRASQPRLAFQVAAPGLSIPESPTNIPPHSLDFSVWNLSWVMKDSSPSFVPRGRHFFDCNFESPCDLEYFPPMRETHNRSWHRVSADELSQIHLLDGPERDYSDDSTKGSFLYLNTTESMKFLILSPWLKSSSEDCTVQVAVYRYFQQSGEYVVQVLYANESRIKIPLISSREKHG
ncbi:ALK tyrosine kinase receptor-like [Sceloporus undulatus]|uniref:ALK tyrosine kinase receptor-like n=1 Tax=Sceloporus undulatus TaxID=8520 RepID=UPI001C4D971C|nr:ALK tyrosine kinase receptor-like [Sceloporus undulatus]